MKKQTLNLLVASAFALGAASAQAEPTRLFSQETAEVSKDMSLDMDYNFISSGFNGALRVGAFGGELLVNGKNGTENALAGSGFIQPNVGFKMGVARNVAVYGFLSYDKTDNPGPGANPPADTNFAFGAVYTQRMGGNLLLNAAAEFVTDDNNGNGRSGLATNSKNTVFVKLGGAYTLPDRRYGRMSLIGEVIGENSDFLDTHFNIGLRWELRRNLTADFVFHNDRGSKGGAQTGFPGLVKLNWAF